MRLPRRTWEPFLFLTTLTFPTIWFSFACSQSARGRQSSTTPVVRNSEQWYHGHITSRSNDLAEAA